MEYTKNMTKKELQAWRKKNGYSQSQLAKVLGVTTLTISRWERGERGIPSFLALTLECVERKGDELRVRDTKKKMKKKREVKK
jgi:transcriptional regulator with XRE-family HTH domain